MGGMGFIENNKAECMLSVLVNTKSLRASKENNCNRFFFQVPVYNGSKQDKTLLKG